MTGGLTVEALWDQIFALMYMQEGTGLGMALSDVMELEAVHKDRLLSRLRKRLEDAKAEVDSIMSRARKR